MSSAPQILAESSTSDLDSNSNPEIVGLPATNTPPDECYQEDNDEPPTSIQSIIDKFVNTSWKTEAECSAEEEENNSTIDAQEPPSLANRGSFDSSENLNSTYEPLLLTSGVGSGTVLFQDDCCCTSGWISQSNWPGDLLMTQLQTGIALQVSDGRYKSGDIPALPGVYVHGPMWTKTLDFPAAVGEGLNLEVNLQHIYQDNKMGRVGVAVYDFNDEIIFHAWIHDGWYGQRSDAYVGYYFLGSSASIQSVQKSGTWSGILKIWYDKESDSIKANVPDASFTLVTNPSEEELTRFAKTVAIYFGRIKDQNYASKFIDSILLSVDTNPNTGYPATPLSPAMDSHWFPKTAYSRLYFEVDQPFADLYYNLRIRIECDQDIYARTFTVIVNNIEFYSGVINTVSGFDGVVTIPYLVNVQKVVLQIRWGAYVEKGWKLTYFYPERANGEPLEVVSEYFPQMNPARLTYLARLGPDTKINIKQEADQDTIIRTTRVYVDGQLKHSAIGDNAWEWSIGDYTYDSLHEVIIELQYGAFAEWGKKLSINRVHYLAGQVEIDYMDGHAPTQDDISVLEAYYINMGYQRSKFYIDDLVPFVYEFDLANEGYLSQQYWDYSDAYRDHAGDWRWEWMLCLNYISCNGERSGSLGYHIRPHYGIVIHDQLLMDLAYWPWTPPISAYRRSVIFHEYGHHINIIDRYTNNDERYCNNWYCAMSTADFNIVNYPWYCEHHWSLRRWPGW